jgi:hypothetical protein
MLQCKGIRGREVEVGVWVEEGGRIRRGFLGGGKAGKGITFEN